MNAASFLRRQLLGKPLAGPSLPLDVGQSDDIPVHLRRLVALRDQTCQFPGGCDQRMHNGLELFQRRLIAEHAPAELDAVDLAVRRGAGKRRLDRRDRRAVIELVHGGVGVMHRHAFFGEHFRRRRFSHAERAGEAEDEHEA